MAITPPMCSMAGAIATGSIKSAACQLICGVSKCGTANHGAFRIGVMSTKPINKAAV